MKQEQRMKLSWPIVIGLAAIAAALGFGAANWFAKREVQTDAQIKPPAASTPAEPQTANNSAEDEVKIPAEYLSASKISVEEIRNGGLEAEILAAATVVATPNSEAVIMARASGNVTRVSRQLGDTVRAGETLAQVSSSDAAAMNADRNVAIARVDLARKSYARESSLFEQGVTPRQEMEAAQSALAVAESEALRAISVAKAAQVTADGKSVAVVSPINGKITAQTVTLGGFVQPQTELFRIAGNGKVLVEASLPAADVTRVATGDTATILAANGSSIEATVRSVTPTVSGSTRTATVVLTPISSSHGLIVGEGVQARIHAKNGTPGLVVAEDAVQNVDGRDVLFVRTKDGFRVQPVFVGTRSGGVAQIISGVSAGELVATRNAFLVKADMIKSAKEE